MLAVWCSVGTLGTDGQLWGAHIMSVGVINLPTLEQLKERFLAGSCKPMWLAAVVTYQGNHIRLTDST